jgi:hypothetical protein
MKKHLKKIALVGLLAFALPVLANAELVCVRVTVDCGNGVILKGHICGETIQDIMEVALDIADIVC